MIRTLLSLVIPCYNEQDNLQPLVKAIREAIRPLQLDHEIIITDDCSTDGSWAVMKELAAADNRVRVQRLASNGGESAALWAGMQIAQGQYIITMDSDLQNDPAEIPKFIEALKTHDCVCGSRAASRHQGDTWIRIVSSRIANGVRNALLGDGISDSGCTYRAFKRQCVAGLKFFKGMHRFMPALIKMEGFSVIEIPVTTHPRLTGQGHYGVWNRLFAAFYDLLAVRWMKKRMFRIDVAERVN